jgi:Tfp pilus assembly ATPase PilU
MINTLYVSDLMLNGEIYLIKEDMEKGAEYTVCGPSTTGASGYGY